MRKIHQYTEHYIIYFLFRFLLRRSEGNQSVVNTFFDGTRIKPLSRLWIIISLFNLKYTLLFRAYERILMGCSFVRLSRFKYSRQGNAQRENYAQVCTGLETAARWFCAACCCSRGELCNCSNGWSRVLKPSKPMLSSIDRRSPTRREEGFVYRA